MGRDIPDGWESTRYSFYERRVGFLTMRVGWQSGDEWSVDFKPSITIVHRTFDSLEEACTYAEHEAVQLIQQAHKELDMDKGVDLNAGLSYLKRDYRGLTEELQQYEGGDTRALSAEKQAVGQALQAFGIDPESLV